MIQFNFISLFPELIQSYFSDGVVGQAQKKGQLKYQVINPRDFTEDVHHSVDDRPFGGGDGMLMMTEPLKKSLDFLGADKGKVVYLSPAGKTWTDSMARDWAKKLDQPLTFICGRYAGIDERFVVEFVDEEISLGDFVLSGGELAALALADSLARLQPGVLGNQVSAHLESFAEGLLECPAYTRPREFMGMEVPEVLLSGNHQKIEKFKSQVSLLRTALRRPDLLKPDQLDQVYAAAKAFEGFSDGQLRTLALDANSLKRLLRTV